MSDDSNPLKAGRQPTILMCPPDFYGINYEINPWMDVRRGADIAQATQQWRALKAKAVALGAKVELLAPQPDLPDLVFTANAGLVYRKTFIGSSFRHPVRQGESPFFDDWFASHGFTVIRPPADIHFEGAGDALFCGETLFFGFHFRSDPQGHAWLGEVLGLEVLPLELVDPRFYHLDTCFCPLDEQSAIIYPGAFDSYALSAIRSRVGRLIQAEEAEAAEFCCNAVVIGRDVIMNDVSPTLQQSLAEAGFQTHPLPLGEFIKSGGSAKCLTIRIDGEEAAAWAG